MFLFSNICDYGFSNIACFYQFCRAYVTFEFLNYVVFCFDSWKEILVIRIYSIERRKKNISGIYYIRVIIDVYNGCSDKRGSTTLPIPKLKIFGGKHGSASDLYRTFGFRNCRRSILCRLSIIE